MTDNQPVEEKTPVHEEDLNVLELIVYTGTEAGWAGEDSEGWQYEHGDYTAVVREAAGRAKEKGYRCLVIKILTVAATRFMVIDRDEAIEPWARL